MKAETYNRARLEILNYILNFSTVRSFGSGHISHMGDNDATFSGSSLSGSLPEIGSLVLLTAAPFTKWYLSWLVSIESGASLGPKFLLKSIEDGAECWWSNVAVCVYSPKKVEQYVRWRWSDSQFEFNNKVQRAFKRKGAYITLACFPQFDDKGGVTLSTRERFGLSPYSHFEYFPAWKKITSKQIGEFYDKAISLKPSYHP